MKSGTVTDRRPSLYVCGEDNAKAEAVSGSLPSPAVQPVASAPKVRAELLRKVRLSMPLLLCLGLRGEPDVLIKITLCSGKLTLTASGGQGEFQHRAIVE